MNVGLGEKLELFTDELDAFAVGAIDIHGEMLDAVLVAAINKLDKLV